MNQRRALVGGPFFLVLLAAAIVWLRSSPFEVREGAPEAAPADLAAIAAEHGMAVVACAVDRWFEEDPAALVPSEPPFEVVAPPRHDGGWVFAVVPAGSGSAGLAPDHLPGTVRFRWTEVDGFGMCDDFGTVYDETPR